jgi:transcriptional regulator with XRE-family HTH domain
MPNTDVEVAQTRGAEPAVAEVARTDTRGAEPAVAEVARTATRGAEPAVAEVAQTDTRGAEPAVAEAAEIATRGAEPAVAEVAPADARAPETGPHRDDCMAELARSMKAMGLTQTEMGQLIGCSQSSISKLLRGQPVALSTVQAARAWLQSISDEADPRQVEERPGGLDVESSAADPIPMAAPGKPSPASQVPLEAGLPPDKAPPDNAPEPESRPGLEEGLVPPSPLVETVTSDPVMVSGPAFQVDDRLSAAGSPETADQGQPSSRESCGDPEASEALPSPYEAVLRTMLEQVAQKHLEEVAGPAAARVVVRVTLEWRD